MRIFFFLIFISLSTTVFSDNNNLKKISWENPEGIEFQIDLYQDGLLIKTYQSNSDFIELELPPGAYSYQLNFINKFGRLTALGDPVFFELRSIIYPILYGKRNYQFFEKQDIPELIIELKDFLPEGRIYLLQDGREISLEYIQEGQEKYKINWNPEKSPAGEYSLVLENPDKSSSTYDRFLTIIPSPTPVIESISPEILDISDAYAELIITGDFFSDEMEFRLYQSSGMEIPLRYSRIDSSSEVHLWIELNEKILGSGNIKIFTPWGEEVEKKRALVINNSQSRRNYYRERTWGTDLLIGFPGQGIEEPFKTLPSAELQWRADFALDSFILRQTGVLLNMDYYKEDPYSLLGFGGGLYYRTRIFIPVNFMFSGLFGIKFDESWKNGPYVQAQAALVIQFNHVLVEPYIQAQRWYGATRNQDYLTAGLRTGFRF